jgi:hypothetical protein
MTYQVDAQDHNKINLFWKNEHENLNKIEILNDDSALIALLFHVEQLSKEKYICLVY